MGITAKIPSILAPLPYGGGHPPTENVKGITLTKDNHKLSGFAQNLAIMLTYLLTWIHFKAKNYPQGGKGPP